LGISPVLPTPSLWTLSNPAIDRPCIPGFTHLGDVINPRKTYLDLHPAIRSAPNAIPDISAPTDLSSGMADVLSQPAAPKAEREVVS
jgi:hypothetical protein